EPRSRYSILTEFATSKSLPGEPHQPAWHEIRHEKPPRLTRLRAHRLGRQMPAARRAFHRRRPPRLNPVARKKQIRPWRVRPRPRGIDPRRHTERRPHLLHQRGLHDLRASRLRKELLHFLYCLRDRLLTRQFCKSARCALHQLDVVSRPPLQLRLVIHPVQLAIEKHRVFQIRHFAVEPQVHTRKRPVHVPLNLRRKRPLAFHLRQRRQKLLQALERQSQHDKIGPRRLVRTANPQRPGSLRCIPCESFHRGV